MAILTIGLVLVIVYGILNKIMMPFDLDDE